MKISAPITKSTAIFQIEWAGNYWVSLHNGTTFFEIHFLSTFVTVKEK